MFTPTEKSPDVASFAGIPDFHGIQPCNTAAFYGHTFSNVHLKIIKEAILGVVPEGGFLGTVIAFWGNETPSPLISFNPADPSIPIRTFHDGCPTRIPVSDRGSQL
jgi:hypothetical protein